MIKVFEACNHAEAAMVVGLLEAMGIPSRIRGEALFTTVEGAAAIPGMSPAVWIEDADQLPAARATVERYGRGEAPTLPGEAPWTCPDCAESHEPQFQACWQCGRERSSPMPPGSPEVPSH